MVDLAPGSPWSETAVKNDFPDARVGTLHPAQARITVPSWTVSLSLQLLFNAQLGDLDLLLSQDGPVDAIHHSAAAQTSQAPESLLLSASGEAMLPGGDYYVAVVNYATVEIPFMLTLGHVVVTPTPTPTATPTPTGTPTATPTASPTPIPEDVYDLNQDGLVDAADLLLLMDYMHDHDTRVDFNADGRSDQADCLRFSLHWFQPFHS